MRRFSVKMSDYKPMKLYYKDLETAKENNKDCIITEIEDDTAHLPYIEKIQNKSKLTYTTPSKNGTKYIYDYDTFLGKTRIILYEDKSDNHFYDYAEYTFFPTMSGTMTPILRTMSTPKKVYEKFILDAITYEIISKRKYGEPKLNKPKILKGITAKSVDFIPKKCKCKYYICGNDIVMLHRDYFSPPFRPKLEDIGKPLSYILNKYFHVNKNDKFVYPDAWGDVVLRSEAYICFKNIIPYIDIVEPRLLSNKMCLLIKKYHYFTDDLDYYWHTMFETMLKEIRSEKVNG